MAPRIPKVTIGRGRAPAPTRYAAKAPVKKPRVSIGREPAPVRYNPPARNLRSAGPAATRIPPRPTASTSARKPAGRPIPTAPLRPAAQPAGRRLPAYKLMQLGRIPGSKKRR